MKKISEVLNINSQILTRLGVLDQFVWRDAPVYVNPSLLTRSGIIEFDKSEDSITTFFLMIMQGLSSNDIRVKEQTIKAFDRYAHEPEFGHLGTAKTGNSGRGIGVETMQRTTDSLQGLINAGITHTNIYKYYFLFSDGIGFDFLSDLILNICAEDFSRYSLRIQKEISTAASINWTDQTNIYRPSSLAFPVLPGQDLPCPFFPTEVLADLPIATSFADFVEIARELDAFRNHIQSNVGIAWEKKKADTLRIAAKYLANNKDEMEVLEKALEKEIIKPYDFQLDPKGVFCREIAVREMVEHDKRIKITPPVKAQDVLAFVISICNRLKFHVEKRGKWKMLYNYDTKRPLPESVIQAMFDLLAYHYAEANGIDVSPEVDSGVGPVDFKLSSGSTAKILVEIKKSSSTKCVAGYSEQLKAYQEADDAHGALYLIVNYGGKNCASNIASVKMSEKASKKNDKKSPELFIIDGQKQKSASKRPAKRSKKP